MNYDSIAGLKVDSLRKLVRGVREEYNELTNSRLTAKEIRIAPKARLLYIYCRYWAETDAHLKWDKVKEELELKNQLIKRQRAEQEALLQKITEWEATRIHPPIMVPVKNPITGRYVLTIRKEDEDGS